MTLRRALLTPVLATVAVLAVGCSGEVSVGESDDEPRTLDRAEVEAQVSEQLEETVGQAPDSVDCPDDLEAEVDVTMRCTLTAGPDTVGLTLTVTEVTDSNVKFDIDVDDEVQE